MAWITEKEYVEKGGLCCPCCGSHEIEGGSVEVSGGMAFQEITCGKCGAGWDDEYKLTGYTARGEAEG